MSLVVFIVYTMVFRDSAYMHLFPKILSTQSGVIKVNYSPLSQLWCSLSLLLLDQLITRYSRLTKQRMSVPELMRCKWKTYVISITCILSIISVILILFLNITLQERSILFAIFMFCSIICCLCIISISSQLFSHDHSKYTKIISLYLMTIQMICCNYLLI